MRNFLLVTGLLLPYQNRKRGQNRVRFQLRGDIWRRYLRSLIVRLKRRNPEMGARRFSTGGLDPSDVVIVVKTGASSIWRRMPMHMSTTLGNPNLTPNVLYYSDSPDHINGYPVIDALANVSASLKASPDFTLYHKAAAISADNLYLESGSMEGDMYFLEAGDWTDANFCPCSSTWLRPCQSRSGTFTWKMTTTSSGSHSMHGSQPTIILPQ